MKNAIEVTGCCLTTLVKKAYELSRAQGLGVLHYNPAPLTDEQANALIRGDDARIPVSLDYVAGRAVKFTVWRDGDKLWIRDSWYDHSPEQLRELLKSVGLDLPAKAA